MKEETIKVIMLQPGKLAKTVEIDASLEGMQRAVGGGLIEPVYIFDEEVCLVCNVQLLVMCSINFIPFLIS